MPADVAPAAGEGTHDVTETGVGAVAAHERSHAAQGEETEVAFQIKAGVPAEKPAVLAESSGVVRKAVFKHKPHFEGAREFFASFDADAGADPLTGCHFERVGVGLRCVGFMLPCERGVDGAVHFNGSGRRGTGEERGGRRGKKTGSLHGSDSFGWREKDGLPTRIG